jgi:signal transduction histidine kinase/CheY-like chemotaxis protein
MPVDLSAALAPERRPDPSYFRAELLPGLAYVPMAAALLVLYLGVDPERFETWLVLFAFAGLTVLVRWLRNVNETATGIALTVGLLGAAILAVHAYPNSSVACLLALPVGVATILLGTRAGIAVAVVATLVADAGQVSGALVPRDVASIATVLIWTTVLLFWLGMQPLYAVLDWAWHSYMVGVEKTRELRERQGELGRLSKSLSETVVRLEDLNRELERARLDAEHARRLKDEFATAVSHELRTPLNVIIAFSEMMVLSAEQSYGEPLPAAYRDDVEAMYRNAYHLSNLIAIQREVVPLANVVDDAMLSVASLYRDKGLRLERELPDDLPLVSVDPTRIRQILINLLANAVRFTDQGGTTIRAERRDNDVVVTVADTGVGMTPTEVERIFEPFRQFGDPSRQRTGHGLGLAISKRLVELHGGSMWVESRAEEGSRFSFTLPLQQAVVAGVSGAHWERWLAPQLAQAPRTVMVVDRTGDLTRILRRYLDGYRVVRASSRAQAERLIASEPISAVVESQPEGEEPPDGRRRARLGDLPVIRCALRAPKDRQETLGVAGFLQKPVTRQQLVSALRRLERPVHSILVVDDDPDMARLVGRIARSWRRHCEVRTAPDGAVALDLLRERPADVVLLDLLMPGLDGYGTLEALAAERGLDSTPVIVISGRGKETESYSASFVAVSRGEGLPVGEAVRCVRASLDALLAPTRAQAVPTRPGALVG